MLSTEYSVIIFASDLNTYHQLLVFSYAEIRVIVLDHFRIAECTLSTYRLKDAIDSTTLFSMHQLLENQNITSSDSNCFISNEKNYELV
jgi:hypothetical protein